MAMDERPEEVQEEAKKGAVPAFEDASLMGDVEDAMRIAAEEEGSYRYLSGYSKYIVPTIAFVWCLFQLAIASWWMLDTVYIRAIHLGFAMLIAFLSYPALKKPRKGVLSFLSSRTSIPIADYILAILACLASVYILIDYTGMSLRMGAPIFRDVFIGFALVVLLLEAARRVIGPALEIGRASCRERV